MDFRVRLLLYICVSGFVFPVSLFGQEATQTDFFYKIIEGDSVVMFFDRHGNFIDEPCADYKRYTRVNENGSFNGFFKDVDIKTAKVRTRGHYASGQRDGIFEIYYPDGTLKVRSTYRQNLPVGKWEYFYDNGRPERTLEFSPSGIMLTGFADKQGNVWVKDGYGEFKGEINGKFNAETGGKFTAEINGMQQVRNIFAKGPVRQGKPYGLWSAAVLGEPYGGRSGSWDTNEEEALEEMSTFALSEEFEKLELFQIARCLDTVRYGQIVLPLYLGLFDAYPPAAHEVKFAVDEAALVWDFQKQIRVPKVGVYEFTVRLILDEQGRVRKLETDSSWDWAKGYRAALVPLFKQRLVFPKNAGTVYYHVQVQVHESSTISRTFYFSLGSVSRYTSK